VVGVDGGEPWVELVTSLGSESHARSLTRRDADLVVHGAVIISALFEIFKGQDVHVW
jgi:hypothetical protein